jgi:hypothetical protein
MYYGAADSRGDYMRDRPVLIAITDHLGSGEPPAAVPRRLAAG